MKKIKVKKELECCVIDYMNTSVEDFIARLKKEVEYYKRYGYENIQIEDGFDHQNNPTVCLFGYILETDDEFNRRKKLS